MRMLELPLSLLSAMLSASVVKWLTVEWKGAFAFVIVGL